VDGALAGSPRLVNPPWDPAWRAHADAAIKAVKSCDPLHVPDKYAPYYSQWKTKTVFFDPTRS
jgi:colicin import membrane protein